MEMSRAWEIADPGAFCEVSFLGHLGVMGAGRFAAGAVGSVRPALGPRVEGPRGLRCRRKRRCGDEARVLLGIANGASLWAMFAYLLRRARVPWVDRWTGCPPQGFEGRGLWWTHGIPPNAGGSVNLGDENAGEASSLQWTLNG